MRREVSDLKAMEATIVIALFCLLLDVVFKIPHVDVAALVLIFIAVFFKKASKLIALAWLKFAELLGNVNSFLILSFIFYLFLTPVAFLYRVFNKNPMSLKRGDKRESYFCIRDHEYTGGDLEKLW